ncbi:TonB-dependent receptor [Novosphingobium sp. SG707]|uniref:TonB-dependent receptor n=1 Tax=Novosphingobium sp. SG707 TaxID=2586996 RepID=UPI0014485352|nr:TonB-dependent receptor [Novosphingobium sp. SG707]NKI98213.1 outer membrane receptor protein involved in Fe transport [Novosphingobium sp. SG707]
MKTKLCAAWLLSVSTLAVSTLGAAPAMAQTAGQGDDIVVTALKRETRVQDTPLAITAMSGNMLNNMGATGIADVARSVPSLNLLSSESGRTRVSIRGIQTAGEATVGVYFGEVPLTGPAGTTSDPSGSTPNLNLFDTERLEVLRGPQGTLYGSGSMGGTLRVLFKQANLKKYEAAVDAGAESTKDGGFGYSIKGAVNVPIIEDMLAARLVLYRQRTGGFVDDPSIGRYNMNSVMTTGGRLMLGFRPTNNLRINFMGIIQDQHTGGTSLWAPSVGTYTSGLRIYTPAIDKQKIFSLDTKWTTPIGTISLANGYYRWDVRQTNDNSDNYQSVANSYRYCGLYQNTYSGSLLQTGASGTTTSSSNCASSAGGYTSAQLRANYLGWANSQMPIGNYQPRWVENVTNELRLNSDGKGRLNYTLGAFFENRKDRVDTTVFAGVPGTGEMRSPLVDLGSRFVRDVINQTAQFGELSYRPIDILTVTAGLRHYHYKKIVGGAYLGYNYFNGQTPMAYTEVNANADGFIQKYNVELKPTRNLMVYATASQGFRPGGANLTPGIPASATQYKADSLWNYELGLKTQWFDRKLTFNIDAYRIDWTNMQTSVQATYGNFSYISNVGAARIEGFEAELSGTPTKGLFLNGSLSVVYPRLTADQVNSEVTAAGRVGNILTGIPRTTASAGAEYGWDINSKWKGMMRADFNYTGKMTTQLNPTNALYRTYGKYSQVNLRAGIENERYGVYVYVRNLIDAKGLSYYSAVSGTPDYIATTTPRTVGINLRGNF